MQFYRPGLAKIPKKAPWPEENDEGLRKKDNSRRFLLGGGPRLQKK